MIYAEIVVFIILAVGMFVWRQRAASIQSMAFGARLPIGCVVIECFVFLGLALLMFVFRSHFQ